jgi:hypothetical protein
LWAKSELDDQQAMALAVEAQHSTRRTRRSSTRR